MMNKKVVKGLECCTEKKNCKECPYFCFNSKCQDDMNRDVLILLKEQEAVEPRYNARTNWYECGACKFSMTSGMHCKGILIPAYKVGFCAKCGKAVKWNE